MPTFTRDDPLWTPRSHRPDDEVIHLVDHMVEPGEMATALCGHRWRVNKVHSRPGQGWGLATCDDCLARTR